MQWLRLSGLELGIEGPLKLEPFASGAGAPSIGFDGAVLRLQILNPKPGTPTLSLEL